MSFVSRCCGSVCAVLTSTSALGRAGAVLAEFQSLALWNQGNTLVCAAALGAVGKERAKSWSWYFVLGDGGAKEEQQSSDTVCHSAHSLTVQTVF